MKILVAGATGVVGRFLVPMLFERGHEVYATTTREDNLELISKMGATPLLLDGLDATAVNSALQETRPEAIIHEMSALKGTPDFRHFDRWFAKTNELRTKGTDNLLDAARQTGTVKRFVAQSYTGWTNTDTGGPATEDEPTGANPAASQRETMAAIKTLERTVLGAPLEAIVLRYANLYGPYGFEESVRALRRRQLPIMGDGSGIVSWLHAEDAARATVEALENGTPGVYNVADDDPAPLKEWLPYLAEVVGAPRPMRIPLWLANLIAGDAAVRMFTRGRGVSNGKIKRELGWRPIYASWREGFKTIIGQESDKELINVSVS
jgi:2-alkyl-3-oxoalkanoate reductase